MSSVSFPHSIGVVFDLDGIIIDSHDQHHRSWHILAEELGSSLTNEQFKTSFGMRNESCIPDVFGWAEPGDHAKIANLADRKEAAYRELIRAEGLDPLPGMVDLLKTLADLGIPASIGSSTPRENILCAMELTGLAHTFSEANVTGAEDVQKGKPDPEVFLIAASKIGREPAHCLVFEDAHVGTAAAAAAGMKCIAVTTTHPRESFDAVDRIVDSLAEIDASSLRGLWG